MHGSKPIWASGITEPRTLCSMEGKLIFLWSALSNFLSGRGTFPARASPGREGPSSGLELMGSKTRDPALASPDGVLRKMWVTQSFSSAPEKEKASSPPSAGGLRGRVAVREKSASPSPCKAPQGAPGTAWPDTEPHFADAWAGEGGSKTGAVSPAELPP